VQELAGAIEQHRGVRERIEHADHVVSRCDRADPRGDAGAERWRDRTHRGHEMVRHRSELEVSMNADRADGAARGAHAKAQCPGRRGIARACCVRREVISHPEHQVLGTGLLKSFGGLLVQPPLRLVTDRVRDPADGSPARCWFGKENGAGRCIGQNAESGRQRVAQWMAFGNSSGESATEMARSRASRWRASEPELTPGASLAKDMTAPKWCRAREHASARWPEATSQRSLPTGFHAAMNDWFARILSPRPPGHSTHVALARVEYDSASGKRGDSAAALPDREPTRRRMRLCYDPTRGLP